MNFPQSSDLGQSPRASLFQYYNIIKFIPLIFTSFVLCSIPNIYYQNSRAPLLQEYQSQFCRTSKSDSIVLQVIIRGLTPKIPLSE